ncbi:MAG: glycerol-3-phosphate acyltransferase [Anaerolineales bacterium]|nr:glycerol-3-phosphate acyltransferase [Anaerolineales bacterium]
MLIGRLLFAAVFGYIVGAFPTGVLVVWLLGKPDVRFRGSGHTGGSNVRRVAGIAWGVGTALVDVSKGVLAAWLAVRLTGTSWALPAAGMGAVAGHCWSAYVGFAGGMGLSTLGGLFLWQQPLAVFIAVTLWGLGYLLLRNSPRAVLFMAVLMAPVFWLLGNFGYASPETAALGIGGVGVIFVRHLTQLHAYDQRAAAE